ncbi:MAG: FtsK/SpoIIIE domain-containing protein [Microbacterium arborescens]
MTRSDISEPIRLPAPPPEPPRPGFPLWAMLVPVVGAGVLWQVTGSITVLWFAALGPLIALASMLDARRSRGRRRRRARVETDAALAAARADMERRHARERAAAWRRTPDVAGHLRHPDGIWRAVPEREGVLVVGAGRIPSNVRIEGEGEATLALRREAAHVDDAPVTVPLSAGVAVLGPLPVAAAVARGLAVQACLASPPGRVQLAGADEDGLDALPHARAGRGVRLWISAASTVIPSEVEAPIVYAAHGAPPPRCAAVIRLRGVDDAVLEYAGDVHPLRPEPVGADRARAAAELLAARDLALVGEAAAPLSFDDLAAASGGGLRVAVGSGTRGLAEVDLVDDGPHAIVVGVTGSGKSELLTTWVAALAERFPPTRVVFLLVDFKGGRSFDVLRPLPHVTGVVTDLDERAAVRAVDSLAAEVRHRERVLAEHSARDIGELEGILPRLVIVVDEYAALTRANPALHDTFADTAARGRALGMHLILASQRSAGFRESVLANAPLRVALRVADETESRTVLGCIDAAAISGRSDDRGTALLRRAGDAQPEAVRVALCPPAAVDRIASRTERPAAGVRRPWLPPLPEHLPLETLRAAGDARGRVVVGLGDEPDRQRQVPLVLPEDAPGLVVVGRAGSGRSTALRTVAAQVDAERLLRVPADPEAAWDALSALDRLEPGAVVALDDVDALLSRFPADHAAAAAAILERVAREARSRGVRLVLSAQRLTGPVARIVDQIPDRVVLAAASRADHVAFGGDGADWDPRQPPGRGRWHGTLVQIAETAPRVDGAPAVDRPVTLWPRRPTGFVAPASARTEATLAAWRRRGIEVVPFGATTTLRPGRVAWAPAEAWVGRWGAAVAAAGARCHLVVDASYAAEARLITGVRTVPPYAEAGQGRAWVYDTGHDRVRRVVLPAGDGESG